MEQKPTSAGARQSVEELVELSEDQLKTLHPQIAEAIRAIQAERLGKEAFAWQDFSQHKKG